MKRTKKFLINGSILTITNIAMRSIGMVFGLYTSNKIGTEAVGVFGLIMSVYMLAITLATSGLNIACTTLVSKELSKDNLINSFKIVKDSILFALSVSLISSIILVLSSDLISQTWLNSMVSSLPLYLIAIGLPFIAVSSILNGYFMAVRKAYKGAIAQFLEITIKILITIILLNLYSLKNVESICACLILADVISEVFSCTFLLILYKFDRVKYKKMELPNTSYKKDILKITFPVSITSYIRSGLSTLKDFIVPKMLVCYGLTYSIALSEYGRVTGMALPIIMFPNMCISAFSNLLVPEFSSLLAGENKNRIVTVCTKIFKIASFFAIIISSILIAFSNEISYMIFNNLECSNLIKMLSPLILFICLDNIIDNILKGLNKQFKVMVYNIIDLAITIIVLCFLIPVLGINGFIIAIYISELFNFIVSYYQLRKITGFRIDVIHSIFKPVILCLIVYILIYI